MVSVVPPPPPPPGVGSFNVQVATVGSFSAAAPHAVGLAPDLRKRIEATAEQIASNIGADVENTIKQRYFGNPQYGFLFNGEGAEYYAALVAAHSPQRSDASVVEAADLAELLRRWKEPQLVALPADIEKQATEVFTSLGNVASREGIRNGRMFIEAHVGMASGIAGAMMRKICQLPTSGYRVHLLFLLHDVLQLEASKQVLTRPLIAAFKPFLPWLLRPSFIAAQAQGPNSEDSNKILKLLHLWTERGIVTAREGDEIRSIVTARELPHLPRLGTSQTQRPPPPPVPVSPGMAQMTAQQLQPWQQQQHVAQMPQPPMPQQLGNAHLAALGAIRPAAAGLLPGAQLAQTPETIPVGLMASMLRQVSQRGKDMHTAFVPYKPLDPLHTPQTLPIIGSPSERLLKRLQDFYDAIGDARIMPSGSSEVRCEQSSHRSRSRSPAKANALGNVVAQDDTNGVVGAVTATFATVPPPPCD